MVRNHWFRVKKLLFASLETCLVLKIQKNLWLKKLVLKIRKMCVKKFSVKKIIPQSGDMF